VVAHTPAHDQPHEPALGVEAAQPGGERLLVGLARRHRRAVVDVAEQQMSPPRLWAPSRAATLTVRLAAHAGARHPSTPAHGIRGCWEP
jgi:hypothetical protein